jgi:hypothetical protein
MPLTRSRADQLAESIAMPTTMAARPIMDLSRLESSAAAAGSSDGGAGDQRTLNDIAVKEFHDALAKSSDVAVAVAAIKALTAVIRSSTAQTIMGLGKELEMAAQALQRCVLLVHVAWGRGRHMLLIAWRPLAGMAADPACMHAHPG